MGFEGFDGNLEGFMIRFSARKGFNFYLGKGVSRHKGVIPSYI